MNQLSWMIYFAGVSEALKGALLTMFFGTLIVGGCAALVTGIDSSIEKKDLFSRLRPFYWPFIAIVLISGFLVVVFPSKDTIYAIAASEVGEKLLLAK